MKNLLLILLLFLTGSLPAQNLHIGLFGGAAAYNGDITEQIFPKKVTNLSGGINLQYEINEHWHARFGFTYAIVGGSDQYSKKADMHLRNLSFETKINEFSLTGQYHIFSLYDSKITPYLWGGLAVFRFNPYAYDASGARVYLQPLSTEGQGISGYPDRKPYSLTQLAIPFGAGLQYAINDDIRIGLEGGLRKLFTDYLDDVSLNYIDQTDLLNARGQKAVNMAYRGGEVAGGSPIYPGKGAQRGSPKSKDYYYFAGLTLSKRIGNGSRSAYRNTHRNLGCPATSW